jgi:hypothetical protein
MVINTTPAMLSISQHDHIALIVDRRLETGEDITVRLPTQQYFLVTTRHLDDQMFRLPMQFQLASMNSMKDDGIGALIELFCYGVGGKQDAKFI